jgi:hypothetical protein
LTLFSLDPDAARSSAFSTVATRSLISVPEYKLTHFRPMGELKALQRQKWEGDSNFEPPSGVGEGLNCEGFQSCPVANYQGRAFQPDKPLFL